MDSDGLGWTRMEDSDGLGWTRMDSDGQLRSHHGQASTFLPAVSALSAAPLRSPQVFSAYSRLRGEPYPAQQLGSLVQSSLVSAPAARLCRPLSSEPQ
jgi:hypothetical protein